MKNVTLCYIKRHILGLDLKQAADGRILVSYVDEGSPAKKASMLFSVIKLHFTLTLLHVTFICIQH